MRGFISRMPKSLEIIMLILITFGTIIGFILEGFKEMGLRTVLALGISRIKAILLKKIKSRLFGRRLYNTRMDLSLFCSRLIIKTHKLCLC